MKEIAIIILILHLALSQFGKQTGLSEIVRFLQGTEYNGSVQTEEISVPGVQYSDGDIIITVPEGQDTFGG